MVHVRKRDDLITRGGPRFGLVVSKQVGNAVTRHAVSRKLRAVAMGQGVGKHSAIGLGPEWDVVIRALPPAAEATSAELAAELSSALQRAVNKAERANKR